MSYKRLFASLSAFSSVLEFWIDTRNIVAGATDGSENPLTFRIPLTSHTTAIYHNFIIRVNDGRPDVAFDKTVAGATINFSVAGIYKITLIGRSTQFRFQGIDKLKWIYLDKWGATWKGNAVNAFEGFSNLIYRVSHSVKIFGAGKFFKGIKGFAQYYDLALLDVSAVLNFTEWFTGMQLPLYTSLNPFLNAGTISDLYRNVDMSNVAKIEIISSTVTNASYLLIGSNFHGELIIKAPLTTIYQMLFGIVDPPACGQVDVRNVTQFGGWITQPMSQANTDSTLLGWANNFDWSATPVTSRTVNFSGSKYSNNPAVIAAKAFLESKGLIFASLTMA